MRKVIYSLGLCLLATALVGCKAEQAKPAAGQASASAAPAKAPDAAKPATAAAPAAKALEAAPKPAAAKAAAPAQVKGPMAGEVAAAEPAARRGQKPASKFKVWVTDGMQRIGPDEVIGTDDMIKIYAAKREWEPFQVIVNGGKEGLSNINMTVSDLTGPAGTISKKNITLYREQFLDVTAGSATWRGLPNLPLGPGIYPDGLIPFVDPNGNDITGAALDAVPFNLDPNKNGDLFVDVFVPADTKAGTYKGTATVTCNKGEEKLNVELKVWNFELPERPLMRSCWVSWRGIGAKLALDHRLMTTDVAKTGQWSRINAISTGFWSNASFGSGTMKPAPAKDEFAAAQTKYPPEMAKYLYAYTADEISRGTEKFAPTIKEWARNMHEASTIKNLIVMVPSPLLYDDGEGKPAVDIYCVLPVQDNEPNNHAKLQYVMHKLGCEAWTYNTLVQDSYSPKWQIDFRPIEFRIQTWINQLYGYNGMLYWGIDKFPARTSADELTMWQVAKTRTPGDGWMIYPGGPVGQKDAQPSLRLKYLREGEEDYEYIQILKDLGQSDFAMAMVNTVAPDWTNWTRDTRALYNARKLIGEKIDQIKSSKQ